MTKVIEAIASALEARKNCIASGCPLWWDETIEKLNDYLPSGSGVDSGSSINIDESTKDKIIIDTSFHHMDGYGMYDGWTEHTVIVRPSFIGTMDIRVTGRNRDDIKEYLSEIFYDCLDNEVIYSMSDILYVYDNDGKTTDRYTVVFSPYRMDYKKFYICLRLSDNADMPNWSETPMDADLGNEISFYDLPVNVQKVVRDRMAERM